MLYDFQTNYFAFFFYFPFRVSDDVLHSFGGHSVLKILLLEGVLPGK